MSDFIIIYTTCNYKELKQQLQDECRLIENKNIHNRTTISGIPVVVVDKLYMLFDHHYYGFYRVAGLEKGWINLYYMILFNMFNRKFDNIEQSKRIHNDLMNIKSKIEKRGLENGIT